jgi:hypothetical protein
VTSGIFRCADRTRYNKLILDDVFFSSRTIPHSYSDLQEYNFCYVGKCNYEPKYCKTCPAFIYRLMYQVFLTTHYNKLLMLEM